MWKGLFNNKKVGTLNTEQTAAWKEKHKRVVVGGEKKNWVLEQIYSWYFF